MTIRIVDKNSREVLFNSYFDNIESMELAYNKAQEFEEMGLDIELIVPTSTQNLGDVLGYQRQKPENIVNESCAQSTPATPCVSIEQPKRNIRSSI